MKRIISGQAFLYRKGGYASTVIEVKMDERVRGDLLTRALEESLKRYPYLTKKLVEKNGNFYLEDAINSFTVNHTSKYRVLASMSTGYHLLDITFYKKLIRVAFHHALCDGRGIKPFVETLLYYYCSMKYQKNFAADGIRLAGDSLLPGETDEPYAVKEYEVGEFTPPLVQRDGYELPEDARQGKEHFRCDINIDKDQMMAYAKKHGATPATLIALFMSQAIKNVHPNADKAIICSMACDYRKALGMENTFRNCVGTILLPFNESLQNMTFSEQSAQYRQWINEQRETNFIRATVNNQMKMFQQIEAIPTLEERQEKLAFLDQIRINTFVFSYLGQMNFGEYDKHVEAVSLYSSGSMGLNVNMIATERFFTVNIITTFEDERIIEAFKQVLDLSLIEYRTSEKVLFDTKKDKSGITAKRQAEKYFKVME